jgi:hypothetical protein
LVLWVWIDISQLALTGTGPARDIMSLLDALAGEDVEPCRYAFCGVEPRAAVSRR